MEKSSSKGKWIAAGLGAGALGAMALRHKANNSPVPASMETPNSSAVKGINYDEATKQLKVTYRSGGTYDYEGVDPKAWRKITKAKSTGKALHQMVVQPLRAAQKNEKTAAISPLVGNLLAAAGLGVGGLGLAGAFLGGRDAIQGTSKLLNGATKLEGILEKGVPTVTPGEALLLAQNKGFGGKVKEIDDELGSAIQFAPMWKSFLPGRFGLAGIDPADNPSSSISLGPSPSRAITLHEIGHHQSTMEHPNLKEYARKTQGEYSGFFRPKDSETMTEERRAWDYARAHAKEMKTPFTDAEEDLQRLALQTYEGGDQTARGLSRFSVGAMAAGGIGVPAYFHIEHKMRPLLARLAKMTKFAGGPGSGIKHNNTSPITERPKSVFVTIGKRRAIMERPSDRKNSVALSRIKFVAQDKYVIKKLASFMENPKDWKHRHIKVLYDGKDYHLMDGHHRFLAALRLGIKRLPAEVWEKKDMEKKASRHDEFRARTVARHKQLINEKKQMIAAGASAEELTEIDRSIHNNAWDFDMDPSSLRRDRSNLALRFGGFGAALGGLAGIQGSLTTEALRRGIIPRQTRVMQDMGTMAGHHGTKSMLRPGNILRPAVKGALGLGLAGFGIGNVINDYRRKPKFDKTRGFSRNEAILDGRRKKVDPLAGMNPLRSNEKKNPLSKGMIGAGALAGGALGAVAPASSINEARKLRDAVHWSTVSKGRTIGSMGGPPRIKPRAALRLLKGPVAFGAIAGGLAGHGISRMRKQSSIQEDGLSKVAFGSILDLLPIAGGAYYGTQQGRNAAERSATSWTQRGEKTRAGQVARSLGLPLALAGAVLGTVKAPSILHALLRGGMKIAPNATSSAVGSFHRSAPEVKQIASAALPLLSGIAGGTAAGYGTGGLVAGYKRLRHGGLGKEASTFSMPARITETRRGDYAALAPIKMNDKLREQLRRGHKKNRAGDYAGSMARPALASGIGTFGLNMALNAGRAPAKQLARRVLPVSLAMGGVGAALGALNARRKRKRVSQNIDGASGWIPTGRGDTPEAAMKSLSGRFTDVRKKGLDPSRSAWRTHRKQYSGTVRFRKKDQGVQNKTASAMAGYTAGGAGIGALLSYLKQKSEMYSGRSQAEHIDPFMIARASLFGGAAGLAGHAVGKNLKGWGDKFRMWGDDYAEAARTFNQATKETRVDIKDLGDLARKAKGNRFFGLHKRSSVGPSIAAATSEGRTNPLSSRTFVTGLTGIGLGNLVHTGIESEANHRLRRVAAKAGKEVPRYVPRRKVPFMVGGGIAAIALDRLLDRRKKKPEFSPYFHPAMPTSGSTRRRRKSRQERLAPIMSSPIAPIKHAVTSLSESKPPALQAPGKKADPKKLTKAKIQKMV